MKWASMKKVSVLLGTPYVTIEGQTSSQPAPGYAPPPAPGNPSQS